MAEVFDVPIRIGKKKRILHLRIDENASYEQIEKGEVFATSREEAIHFLLASEIELKSGPTPRIPDEGPMLPGIEELEIF